MYRKRPEAPKQPLGRIFDGDTAEVRAAQAGAKFLPPFCAVTARDARLTKVRQYRVHGGSNQN